ncbi:hypothetical protein JR316_0007626 [Psilocybe cubensis]|uniref:Uncharacterized protein n=2 Tax=Psilocybe cubensis TaxID=181762 RepID=A0A8H8CH41_PSICU|nr:hypothetical protein JR316_0007626 [Psilocybe cubensis]KAH9479051.1 hypothetical protein JR316_0007626 [Psilocybe cubensis]
MPTQPHSECHTTKLDPDGEFSDSKGETSVGPKPIPVNLNETEDQNQNISTSTTLDLIRDLIEIQTERKKRAMQKLIRATEDIEDADARLAGYLAMEAELSRRSE